ncbi:hypothetical protein IU501_00200 [Nocardia otitidiscaviarum]|uniref:hypothetical protein n=1 Tax=Nocardia otitidiscaviarum TaxID=1823 RepID=UPI0011DD13DB|nr:hypothetical protein [Nocardia otitidiscaviarum]MBF6131428.1 hypothetical protein [Nocardia otitidiscaviarum]MBF6482574.1 hypothetical protein [Nocardia otitidiscaviarum]
MATWLVAGVVFLSIRGIIVITRLADRDEDLTSSATADVVQLVAIGFFLVLFIFLLGYFLMRPRANYLQLDADSVTQVIGGVTKTIQWDEIDTVAPWTVNDLSTVRIVPAPGVEIQVDTGKSLIDGWQRPRMQREIDLHAAAYGVDPALLLHLVRFYRNHADTRHELLSSTVLDRIRRGDLTA